MGGTSAVTASTTTHVGFLRAINTGGRRISNADLAEAVRSLGFDDVAIYQASGNVLLGGRPAESSAEIADELGEGLTRLLGYDVPAIVRSAAEVHDIAAAAPFGQRQPCPNSKPQVILMAETPDPAEVATWSTDADQLAAAGSEIHWWPTEGISTSDLDVRGLEAAFGTMTVRTLGTIERISARIG